jgi:hypothetical protein
VQKALKEMMELLKQMGMSKQRIEQMRESAQSQPEGACEEQLATVCRSAHCREHGKRAAARKTAWMICWIKPFTALSDRDMDKLRKRSAAAGEPLAQPHCTCARSAPRPASSTPSHHPQQPETWRRALRDQAPRPPAQAQAGGDLRHQHLDAPLFRADAGLVYALQDLVTKTHAFAFIDHLEYISPDFVGNEPNEAIQRGADAHAARPLQHRSGLRAGQTSPMTISTQSTAAPR